MQRSARGSVGGGEGEGVLGGGRAADGSGACQQNSQLLPPMLFALFSHRILLLCGTSPSGGWRQPQYSTLSMMSMPIVVVVAEAIVMSIDYTGVDIERVEGERPQRDVINEAVVDCPAGAVVRCHPRTAPILPKNGILRPRVAGGEPPCAVQRDMVNHECEALFWSVRTHRRRGKKMRAAAHPSASSHANSPHSSRSS